MDISADFSTARVLFMCKGRATGRRRGLYYLAAKLPAPTLRAQNSHILGLKTRSIG
jgi:hypothetical protein